MKPTTVSAALAAAVAVTVVLGVAAEGGQVSPVPRAGTGSVTVEGDVSVKGDVRVVNDLAVTARQSGAWKVGVDGVVTTSPQPLPFVRVGRTYEIYWHEGQPREVVVAREIHGPWVRVEEVTGGRTRVRWLNFTRAMWIEERAG
ncbi:MAG: hypothetical protein ACRD1S_04080 [Vicinamibacterales bacterium]